MFHNLSFWPRLDFEHREVRRDSFKFPFTKLPRSKLYGSYTNLLDELKKIFKYSLGGDYRRKSNKFEPVLIDDFKVKAFITKNNEINLSLGLLIAIEDACQSICSDRRSMFADDINEIDENGEIDLPGVFWANEERTEILLDNQRFVDYSIANNFQNECLGYPFGAFHKFVSASNFRQSMADLISNMAVLWITAHEDAHNYLGHTKYFFDDMSGFPENKFLFFEEFAINSDKREIRLSSEIYADMHASWVLADFFYFNEIYDVYPFLNNWAQLNNLNNYEGIDEIELKKQMKSGHLVRLLIVAQVICICIFERNTIKNNSVNLHHPTLAMRILNIVESTVLRTNAVAVSQNQSKLLPLTLTYLEWIFELISRDLEVVFQYIFQMGFVIKDLDIKLKSIKEVIEFDLSKKRMIDFSLCLTQMGLMNSIKVMWEKADEKRDYSKLIKMLNLVLDRQAEKRS